jgi:hypothetical protein
MTAKQDACRLGADDVHAGGRACYTARLDRPVRTDTSAEGVISGSSGTRRNSEEVTVARLVSSFCLAIAIVSLIGTPRAAVHRGPIGQTSDISITNFSAVDVSSGELRVTVDYTYSRVGQDEVSIHATPEERGGVFDPRTVEFDELPVRPGTHSVTLTIVKRPSARDFASVAVRVCISTPDRALHCQNFPHEKRWTAGTPPTPDPPSGELPKPPQEPLKPSAEPTCSISGQLSGPLEGLHHPDHPGSPTTVRLRFMGVVAADGTRRRAEVKNRRYTFQNLTPGTVYRVSPLGFVSKPRFRNVSCKANTSHHINFQIIGPTPDG